MPRLSIRPATPDDVTLILTFIQELADYERLSDQVVATPEQLHNHLFGARPFAEVLIGEVDGNPSGFALFFHNYSTFLSKPGIYLEDLFVRESTRGSGLGKALLSHLAELALARGCGRLEWSVLDWNEPAIGFYERLGACAQDGWTVYRLTGEALENAGQMALRSSDAV
ncbi:MAG: GNAT family N-acetyltransferase [Gammaproteobacteria bacterium]|nr:GNAT family N-acetyltransferase [Gammaproteobacteria bacterium]MBU1490354.1 GNAT family N-acetyltransferase [Gammaproteobacteria bacterium]MBU2064647.1 GNAT family N-acetyltransferase [Gammaproteobacteria bacterium]MBU2138645.1 GNAT family N-acetyltransferase [Gammaproteobacteria bacterium]MBU2217007.1 GNAT family N-acetyltransferase [Gammaproteobacteria bacterium]